MKLHVSIKKIAATLVLNLAVITNIYALSLCEGKELVPKSPTAKCSDLYNDTKLDIFYFKSTDTDARGSQLYIQCYEKWNENYCITPKETMSLTDGPK